MEYTPRQKAPFTLASPMTRRLSHVTEEREGARLADYAGVFAKCLYFLGAVFLGVALSFLLQFAFASREGFSAPALVGGIVALVGTVLFPFISSFFPRTTPVTGALGCASMGYLLSAIGLLLPEWQGIVHLAMVLTFGIVLSMALIYFLGGLRISSRGKRVLYSILTAYCITSLLTVICAFLPPFRAISLLFATHPLIVILSGLIGVALATVFLMFDFEAVRDTVENRLPKSHEWVASYSLVFTVVWLYMEVLNLLLILNDKK